MEYSRAERYWIWLSSIENVGVKRFEQLLGQFTTPEEVFKLAQSGNLKADSLGPALNKKIATSATEGYIDSFFEMMGLLGVCAVTRENDRYPKLLREIYDPPPTIYVIGREDKPLEPALPIAMVGSRKCSAYGESIAYRFSKSLAENGATVVSGLAMGVDAWAHKGAMDTHAEYPTIAVLGNGVDIKHPRTNEAIYDKIAKRGAIISEFVPGLPPAPGNFPVRNRIISGLSRGTVVVEAGVHSGALITADLALEQGRDVFAVPGRVSDAYSVGVNKLIRDGAAKAIFTPEDVLEEYGFGLAPRPGVELDLTGLTAQEGVLCTLLQAGERSFDELCELMSIPVGELNSSLTSLEFRGIIKQLPGRLFQLAQ